MYLQGCLSAFLSYPLSNLLILKGKKSDPTPPKSIPSHPSHPCALQYKASSYPGGPSPACLSASMCVHVFVGLLCVHTCLRIYLCVCMFLWQLHICQLCLSRPLEGATCLAEVAQPPLKSRKLIAENGSSCRIWRPCLASRLLRKRAADMKETLKLVKSTSRACFLCWIGKEVFATP